MKSFPQHLLKKKENKKIFIKETNNIQFIDPNINFEIINSLDLSNSNQTEFPSINHLTLLKVLHLDSNLIENIPEDFSIESLEVLTISKNRLKSIPENFSFNLPNLKILNIGENFISNMKPLMNFKSQLTHLFIHNNNFIEIDENFHQLSGLIEFGFDWFTYTIPKLNLIQSNLENLFILIKNSKKSINFEEFFKEFSFSINDKTELNIRNNLENILFDTINEEKEGILIAILNCNNKLIKSFNDKGESLLEFSLKTNKFSLAELIYKKINEFEIVLNDRSQIQLIEICIEKLEFNFAEKFLIKNKYLQHNFFQKFLSIFYFNNENSKIFGTKLLEYNISTVNNYDDLGFSAIHNAIKKENLEGLKWAWNYKNIFNFHLKTQKKGFNALHLAVQSNNIEIVQFLLEVCKLNDLIIEKSNNGRTPKSYLKTNGFLLKYLNLSEKNFVNNKLNENYNENKPKIKIITLSELFPYEMNYLDENFLKPKFFLTTIKDKTNTYKNVKNDHLINSGENEKFLTIWENLIMELVSSNKTIAYISLHAIILKFINCLGIKYFEFDQNLRVNFGNKMKKKTNYISDLFENILQGLIYIFVSGEISEKIYISRIFSLFNITKSAPFLLNQVSNKNLNSLEKFELVENFASINFKKN